MKNIYNKVIIEPMMLMIMLAVWPRKEKSCGTAALMASVMSGLFSTFSICRRCSAIQSLTNDDRSSVFVRCCRYCVMSCVSFPNCSIMGGMMSQTMADTMAVTAMSVTMMLRARVGTCSLFWTNFTKGCSR